MSDLVRGLAAFGIPGAAGLDGQVLDADGARALLAAAEHHKLVGLLDQAVAVGALGVPDAVAADIGEASSSVQAWCLLVERHLLAVHDLLDGAGIEHRFLKGSTVAHRFVPHPALRTFVDVDVLVRGEDLDATVGALVAAGHERLQPELRPGFSARWGKSVTVRSPAGVEVDVHRTLVAGPFGLAGSPAPLWARPAATFALGGRDLPCLDAVASFVHAAVHAVTGVEVHLGSVRDVALLVPGAPAGLEDARALAAATRLVAPVVAAARLASSELGIAALPPSAWPVARREDRWLGLYEPGVPWRRQAVAGVAAVPGPVAKLRYAADLARARALPSARCRGR